MVACHLLRDSISLGRQWGQRSRRWGLTNWTRLRGLLLVIATTTTTATIQPPSTLPSRPHTATRALVRASTASPTLSLSPPHASHPATTRSHYSEPPASRRVSPIPDPARLTNPRPALASHSHTLLTLQPRVVFSFPIAHTSTARVWCGLATTAGHCHCCRSH